MKKFTLTSDVDYVGYSGGGNNIEQNNIIWNAALGLHIFKNNRGELKYSVNNILDKNINVIRNIADNYIEDVQNTNLYKFSMIRFIYNLKAGSNKR
jgi:hypothetical protein